MDQQLTLRFKGARDYLQGPDVYNALLGSLTTSVAPARIEAIDISFHRLMSKQLAVVEPIPPGVSAVATCSFVVEGTKRRVGLVETDASVSERYPYPEDEIVDRARFDVTKRSATLEGPHAYSAMEIWVALTKALHLRVYDASVKWLFVRGRFPYYVQEPGDGVFVASIVANFKDRLTRTEISTSGKLVGEIFFSPKLQDAGH